MNQLSSYLQSLPRGSSGLTSVSRVADGDRYRLSNLVPSIIHADGSVTTGDPVGYVEITIPDSGSAATIDLQLFGFAGDVYNTAVGSMAELDLCSNGSGRCSASAAGFILGVQITHRSSTDNGVGIHSISGLVLPGGQVFNEQQLVCTEANIVSPLVIQKNAGSPITTLDPRSTQTFFDLRGDGEKDRISCVRGGAFLALPNSQGRVVDIDQLFGNNTRGPDGLRDSPNGFVALGKYDSNGDGVIDAKDAVFGRLRLWEDENCDGIAQPNEIAGLSDWKILSINWRSFVQMHETDDFGNETLQRSIVKRSSALESLQIFDLWFKPM